MCETFLISQISVDNILEIAIIAGELPKFNKLRRRVVEFIGSNSDKLLCTSGFTQLAEMTDFMKEILTEVNVWKRCPICLKKPKTVLVHF